VSLDDTDIRRATGRPNTWIDKSRTENWLGRFRSPAQPSPESKENWAGLELKGGTAAWFKNRVAGRVEHWKDVMFKRKRAELEGSQPEQRLDSANRDDGAGHAGKQDLGVDDSSKIRSRGPNIKLSRERIDLEDRLRSELANIAAEVATYTTLDRLKTKFPEYQLWQILSVPQQKLLLTDKFKPTAYARTLVTRQYGLTNNDTIKKDRQKLRRASEK
jgi:hypothetical protein